ncbi:MAG: glycosyltransferase family 4 protein, partial [Anaerolineales bacterium]
DLFPTVLLGCICALGLSPLAARAAAHFGLIDVPGSAPHKTHPAATPLVGGPILASAVGVAYLVIRPPLDQQTLGILIAGVLVLVWGLVDDRFRIPPTAKLAGQLLAAVVLVGYGVEVHITRVPGVDLGLTLLWVVGMINAFNFVDSMDGLALGLASVATGFFMLVTLDAVQPELAWLSAAILGAAIGLFFFNASPAKLFLGDSGAQLLGFALAAIGIAYVPAGAGLPQGVSWFVPILVLGVPIFDSTLVVVSRLRRGRPLYQATRDHTYHRLVRLGVHPSRSVLAMHVAAVLLGLLAFVSLGLSVLQANLVFGACALAGVIGLGYLERSFSPGHAPE